MIHIDQATSSDIEEIYRLSDEINYPKYTKQQLMDDLLNQNYKFWLIKEDLIYGYLHCCISIDSVDIISIAVDKDYQHKGYGSLLLNELINYCKINNKEKIFLEVEADNRIAIGCYKKNSFNQIALRKHYYSNGSDAMIMERKIV